MADKDLNERDAKLVQWLSEAHAKEAELEADLTAHIALTHKDAYKKRLRRHLTETKDHKKRVAQRVKQLGGSIDAGGRNVPGVPGAVTGAAGKALAAVKGQVGMARAAVTEQAETHLRNCTEELREEHVEIALYTRIEALAAEVGDRDTAQLAKSIIRDEQRMAKFLDAELRRLVKDVVRNEIPRDQRGTTRRRSTTRRSSSRSASSSAGKSSGARSSAASSRSSGTASRSRSRSSNSASGSRSSRATTRSRSSSSSSPSSSSSS